MNQKQLQALVEQARRVDPVNLHELAMSVADAQKEIDITLAQAAGSEEAVALIRSAP